MRVAVWISLALHLGAASAAAQNVTSSKTIGGWTIRCTVDGMTDATECFMLADGHNMNDHFPVSLSWRDTAQGPALRFVVGHGAKLRDALVRVDQHKPIAVPVCRNQLEYCMPRIEDEQTLAQQIAGGRKMLMRIATESGVPRDYLFDVTELAQARREFERLRIAARQPEYKRPIDDLERKENERVAEARAVAWIKNVADNARARCDNGLRGDEHRNCTATVTMCANNPIPRTEQDFRACFDAIFPPERFAAGSAPK